MYNYQELLAIWRTMVIMCFWIWLSCETKICASEFEYLVKRRFHVGLETFRHFGPFCRLFRWHSAPSDPVLEVHNICYLCKCVSFPFFFLILGINKIFLRVDDHWINYFKIFFFGEQEFLYWCTNTIEERKQVNH